MRISNNFSDVNPQTNNLKRYQSFGSIKQIRTLNQFDLKSKGMLDVLEAFEGNSDIMNLCKNYDSYITFDLNTYQNHRRGTCRHVANCEILFDNNPGFNDITLVGVSEHRLSTKGEALKKLSASISEQTYESLKEKFAINKGALERIEHLSLQKTCQNECNKIIQKLF